MTSQLHRTETNNKRRSIITICKHVVNLGPKQTRVVLPFYRPKAGKDDFQVFVRGDWVQFAHEQHVLWRPYICVREVAHLEEHTTEERINVRICNILPEDLTG